MDKTIAFGMKYRHKRLLWVWICMLLAGLGCKKESPAPAPPGVVWNSNCLWVLNEGNFQFGNASLSVIDLSSGTVYQDVFRQVNQLPTGDVLQSAYLHGGKVSLVVNNSGRIWQVDAASMKLEQNILLPSPRYMHVQGNRAFVSDFAAQGVHVLHWPSGQYMQKISINGWTEQLLPVDQMLWVNAVHRHKIYLLDHAQAALADSIATAEQPLSMVSDKHGRIWVLCGGNIFPSTAPRLQCYHAQSKALLLDLPFPDAPAKPSRLSINAAGDTLYWLYGGLHKMSIENTMLPGTAWISEPVGAQFYGLLVDDLHGCIWVSDAKNFLQSGSVLKYNLQGTFLQSYEVGIIPNAMLRF